MKNLLIRLGLLVFFMAGAAPLYAQNDTELDRLQKNIAELEEQLHELILFTNRITIEKYLEQASRNKSIIPVFNLAGFDWDALFDTVPHLGELHREFDFADNNLRKILEDYPEYLEIKKLAKIEIAEYRKQQGQFFLKLQEQDANYRVARIARDEALSTQNIEIVRYLLEYYQNRGESMPTSGMISEREKLLILQEPIMQRIAYIATGTQIAINELKEKYKELTGVDYNP